VEIAKANGVLASRENEKWVKRGVLEGRWRNNNKREIDRSSAHHPFLEVRDLSMTWPFTVIDTSFCTRSVNKASMAGTAAGYQAGMHHVEVK